MSTASRAPLSKVLEEPAWVRRALLTVAFIFLGFFLFLPLLVVFIEAFKRGWDVYLQAIIDPDALSAIP